MRALVRRRFDRQALYAALDARRRARGISWRQVALETGVAVSTITATQRAGQMETDGMLAMARWLGCAPEKFMRGSKPSSLALTPEATKRFLARGRFNTRALYLALDRERRSRRMAWPEVARAAGNHISPAMLKRLAKGGRIGVDLMVSAVGWLGASVESFTRD